MDQVNDSNIQQEPTEYKYQGQYHPIFQKKPIIFSDAGCEYVMNDRAMIAFSASCHANDALGEYCGLRDGRQLQITDDGRQAIFDLLRTVGSERNEDIVHQTMASIFHYNMHIWSSSAYEARIPTVKEETSELCKDESILYKAPLIAKMFFFDKDHKGFDRPSNVHIYEHRDNPAVHTYIYLIARAISSRRKDGKNKSDDDSDGDLVVDIE